MKNLAEILNSVETVQVTGSPEGKTVERITNDSREAGSGVIFAAVKGYKIDGHRFIPEAISKGTDAVVLEDDLNIPDELFRSAGTVKILVKNSRKALGQISRELFDAPSEKIKLVGITGTKGKTTTAFMLKSIFDTIGEQSGLIGTIENIVGGRKIEAVRTTPESFQLNQLFSDMLAGGDKCCVMEVSSHALMLHRTEGLSFDGAIFTNITSDHMDFHHDFKNYFEAKKILFDSLKPGSVVIYNSDDPNGREIVADSKAEKFSYGFDGESDYWISDLEYDLSGTRFKLNCSEGAFKVETNLIGKFNAYNAASAFAIAHQMGADPKRIVQGIQQCPHVPGRMELLNSDPKKVIIDYSHTAGSLEQALLALRHIMKKKRPVWCVFGCGGDRDKTKRPLMGRTAAQLSDYAIVTSDNPRTEDPFAIIDDVAAGIESNNYEVIENREEAIKKAILNSPENAMVIICGKGHEDYQEINGVKHHFSDKEIAGKYLGEIG